MRRKDKSEKGIIRLTKRLRKMDVTAYRNLRIKHVAAKGALVEVMSVTAQRNGN